MAAPLQFSWWHWAGFIVVILFFLAVDLGLFHRSARAVKFKEAFLWSLLWFGLSGVFALGLVHWSSQQDGLEFFTGYLIELSLSMDNVFVIALIFGFFHVKQEHQHRVLFWGIMGALIMRGIMIGVGAALIQHFHWILYVAGAFLIYTGVKMTVAKQEEPHPEKKHCHPHRPEILSCFPKI